MCGAFPLCLECMAHHHAHCPFGSMGRVVSDVVADGIGCDDFEQGTATNDMQFFGGAERAEEVSGKGGRCEVGPAGICVVRHAGFWGSRCRRSLVSHRPLD